MPHPKFPALRRLHQYTPRSLPKGDMRESAILVPVIKREKKQILYTLRAAHLNKHAGQISFPGGSIDPGETAREAALREAWEEIGLAPDNVKLLGEIDHVFSPRGYHIRCFVGQVGPFEPNINPDEVAKLLEVDLDELFDESLHEVQPWKERRKVHYFNFTAGRVWGVTGYITYRLREILKDL